MDMLRSGNSAGLSFPEHMAQKTLPAATRGRCSLLTMLTHTCREVAASEGQSCKRLEGNLTSTDFLPAHLVPFLPSYNVRRMNRSSTRVSKSMSRTQHNIALVA